MSRIRNKWLQKLGKFFLVLGIIYITLKLLNTLTNTPKFQLIGELVNHVETNEKVVALTYDDGPNPPYTNQLLDLFEQNRIKATFFVIGKNIENHPETVQLILSKGHELGNHSYSHKHMVFKSSWFIRAEIEKTDVLLRQLGVKQEIHFRAPYGRKLLVLPYILAQLGKKNILWTVDPKDFQESNPEAIKNYVLEKVNPGSIILMHDGVGDRSQTIAATEMVIKELQKKGYTFKTVSELLHQTSGNISVALNLPVCIPNCGITAQISGGR